MSMLQFIASLVDSLAWPVVVFAIVFLMRKPLVRVLPTLSRVKYRDVEIDFGRELEKAAEQAEQIDVRPKMQLPGSAFAPDVQGDKPTALLGEAARLAPDFPEAAVAVAWTAIERELMNAVMRLGISPDYPPYNSALKNIQLLRAEDVIDESTVSLLDRMRRLRNIAVHRVELQNTIGAAEAREFVALASGITDYLRQRDRKS